MTANANNPFDTGSSRPAFAFAAQGDRVYVTDADGLLSGFDLDASGTPTPISGSQLDTELSGLGDACAALSFDGRFLFAGLENATAVVSFSIDAMGAPTQVADPVELPVANLSPSSIATPY